ncbi:zinc finger CCCH domain-containing protein 36 [Lolium perenne]|uniref:zinc finger CCCH domain-containing protein 36 n=1 Tax=Lolium perenne TaxID=4522 RepID=UPI0021F56E94|nr:zinc finger CCCH domain-containing protein 36-like [Lolium perenne]
MASASGPVGGLQKKEIADAEMEPPEEAAGRPVGLKRARSAAIGNGSCGFIGVTTAEKKPTLQPHNNVKFLKKAANGNLLRPDIEATSKTGGLYLHDTHGSQKLPDSNALRFSSSSPVGDLRSKTKTPICTFYAQGHCKRGKKCAFRHEREGPGFGNLRSEEEKAGSLAPVGTGKHRGSEEGSEAQCLSNLKDPHFENFAASSKHGLYRTLIQSYGEDHRVVAHNSPTPKVSEESSCRTDDLWTAKPTPPVNELVQIPIVQEKNHEPYFMGRHASLPSDSYLDGRGTLPRLHLDGGKLLSDAAKASSLSDSHISGPYLEVHPVHPDYRYRPFDYLQRSSLASYSSNSTTGFRNPVHNSSDYSLGSQPFRATAHLGMPSLHQLTPGIEKVGLHKDVIFDKGCGTSRPALLGSSSPQPGQLSPIKDEPWITSVPFVPLVDFPGSTSPSYSQYDPLVDSMDLSKVKGINILKSSNISCSTSSQHTTGNVVIDGDTNKSMNYDDKLARNMSAKGSNEFAGLVAPDRERSGLDGDTMVKASERENDAAITEKTRDFRFHLAEHVKELLKPFWKEGNLNKDAHKLIVKKSVDKVLASVELHQVPATKELITDYITMAGTKIEKLVKAYVDKHRMK